MAEKKENPNAFKHWFNIDLLRRLSKGLKSAWPKFDEKEFLKLAPELLNLEMKPRVLLIREALKHQLPADYQESLAILLRSVEKADLRGFDLWPYTEFVQHYGIENPEPSLKALYQLTSRFTAEFAVRPFLIRYPKETFQQLLKWTADSDEHIRRWTSEGSRPRLPWGAKLKASIVDPKPGLLILEKLKFDHELYVRKSIANHLNDITKDHPDLVIATLKAWRQQAKARDLGKLEWIQKQALRTLIKKGYRPALELMGFGKKAQVRLSELKLNKKKFSEKETLSFELELISKCPEKQLLAVDYIIHYQKAKGKSSAKVFKLKVFELKPKESFRIQKNHSLKPVTTRKHYPGKHRLEIQINGHILASADWHLSLK